MQIFILFVFLFFVSIFSTFIYSLPTVGDKGRELHYFIGAHDILWDYAPSTKVNMMGDVFPHANDTIRNRTLYYQYMDETFLERIYLENPSHGDLGPVIRANVFDTIHVHFWNNASTSVSIHPHGVLYEFKDDGSMIGTSPGMKTTIIWQVPERAGPVNGNNFTLWAYHSHVNERDIYRGLMGPIVIYKEGYIIDESHPQEFFLKSIVDVYGNEKNENEKEIEEDSSNVVEMFSINGYIYGNVPEITIPLDSTAIWHLLSFGDEIDIHAMHWHGNVVTLLDGKNVDVVTLFPGSFETAIMKPDSIGRWMYHCHVMEHFEMGMYMHYIVTVSRLKMGLQKKTNYKTVFTE